MKASAKRRRSKAQILEDKANALKKEAELQDKLAQWDQMQRELNQYREQNQLLERQTQDVQKMFEDGVLKTNENGQYEAVLDPAESEYLKSEISKTNRKNCMSAVEAEQIQKQLEGAEEESGME